MENIVSDTPNLTPETVPVENVSPGTDPIAVKMAAMRQQVRNQTATTEPTTPGVKEAETPVAPTEVGTNEPEVVEPDSEHTEANEELDTPEEVSTNDSTNEDIIDFLAFAKDHPTAKFRFIRNGKEIEIDAQKAASILGQGAAISEDARQLKIEKAEFEEYLANKRSEAEGLVLALQFTVQPQLQQAYDNIIKVQGYQAQFQQTLARTNDPVDQARIQANMQQNERYIQEQRAIITNLQPKVQEFYDMRRKQVSDVLENNRKSFQDKELRNRVIYDEIRSKVANGWEGAKHQLVPGIDNLDLISSDEHILSLLRDGLRYRDRPKAKQAGNSFAAVTTRKSADSINVPKEQDNIGQLREKAKSGDKEAGNNLLAARLQALRASRAR